MAKHSLASLYSPGGSVAVLSGVTMLLVALLHERAIRKEALISIIDAALEASRKRVDRSPDEAIVAVLESLRDTAVNFPDDAVHKDGGE